MNLSFRAFLLIILAFYGGAAQAQWTDDTQINTVVDPTSGDKAVTHIEQTPDGKYFISWYGGMTNYDMNLALLDEDGVAVWNSPKQVSNEDQNSWLADYSLSVDGEGNAIIAFSDTRNESEDIFIYKVDQSGEMIFGNNGIQLSDSPESEYFPTMCVTESNEIVVTWQRAQGESVVLVMQRFTEDGDKLWGDEGIVLSLEEADYNTPLPVATTNDEVIILYHIQTGPFFSPSRTLHAQRFDEDGNPVWSEPAMLCGETNIPGFTFPQAKSDGNGGLITSWLDDRDENTLGNVAVQHVHSDGTLQFPVNGVELAQPQNLGHYSPVTAGIDDEGSIVVYWRTTNSSQQESGLQAQKVASNGELQWGDQGVEILPVGSRVQLINDAVASGDSSWVCYAAHPEGSFADNHVLISGLNGSGEVIADAVPVSTSSDTKEDIELSGIFEGKTVASWVDDAIPNKVKAQRIVLFDPVSSIGELSSVRKNILEQRGLDIHIDQSAQVEFLDVYGATGQKLNRLNVRGAESIDVSSDLKPGIYILLAVNIYGEIVDSKRILCP